ncbi:MAG: transposase, partial [Phycisphaeraceae bacterium]|nr:transposase [Phycisphaeraceae bacterium]
MIIRYPMVMCPGPRAMRGQRSRPIVEALIEWCEVQAADALPESGLGEAVHCVLNQARALSRYLDDDRLAIDNNACERSLRGNAIGRKNWLFT